MRVTLSVVSALVGLVSQWSRPASAPAQVPIKEWPVPYSSSRPRDPYIDSQNRVWFVGQVGNYIAYLDPASGKFRRYEIDEGTLPHNLIVDRNGMVWYAGNGNGHIGKLDPTTGKITRYPMPNPEAQDPHTLVFDQKGDIWFTVQNGNFVGRLATRSGKVDLIKVATPGARPYGIKVDSKGRPWFNATRAAEQTQQLEEVGAKLRAMMPFLNPVTVRPDGQGV